MERAKIITRSPIRKKERENCSGRKCVSGGKRRPKLPHTSMLDELFGIRIRHNGEASRAAEKRAQGVKQ